MSYVQLLGSMELLAPASIKGVCLLNAPNLFAKTPRNSRFLTIPHDSEMHQPSLKNAFILSKTRRSLILSSMWQFKSTLEDV
jgi:hypothetical protein